MGEYFKTVISKMDKYLSHSTSSSNAKANPAKMRKYDNYVKIKPIETNLEL